MTLFEYVAVAASLVWSFAAARLLGGLAAVLRPGRRYWVHAIWVGNVIFAICLGWWLFWSFREVDWNFPRFLMALFPAATIYVTASLLIPADPESVPSWRQYYFQIRIRFFALNLTYLAANFLNIVVLLGQPIIHRGHILFAVFGGLYSVGVVSSRPKLHASIALIFTVCHVLAAALAMRAGSFGSYP